MTKQTLRHSAAERAQKMLDTGFFRALCEPVRVEIMSVLIRLGRSDVNGIAEEMPQDRSVISRHLQVMERAGIVFATKEGRHTFYQIDGPGNVRKIETLLNEMKAIVPFCCPREEGC